LKIEHLLDPDCWIIDAGFWELKLLPKSRVSSWKSPIDILPVKKPEIHISLLA